MLEWQCNFWIFASCHVYCGFDKNLGRWYQYSGCYNSIPSTSSLLLLGPVSPFFSSTMKNIHSGGKDIGFKLGRSFKLGIVFVRPLNLPPTWYSLMYVMYSTRECRKATGNCFVYEVGALKFYSFGLRLAFKLANENPGVRQRQNGHRSPNAHRASWRWR